MQPAVDPHQPRLQPLGEPAAALHIARPDAAGQAEFGVVGNRQRLLVALERVQRHHRAEDFLGRAARIRRQALNHCRLEECAAVERRRQFGALATAQDGAALLTGERDIALDLHAMLLRNQRAQFATRGVADGHRLDVRDKARDELVPDRALDEQAAAAKADLSLVHERRARGTRDCLFEVGVRADNRGVLAPQFERELLEMRRGAGGDAPPRGGAARKGDGADRRMLYQRAAADGTAAVDQVDDAGRQSRLGHDLGEQVGGQWRQP